MDADAKERIRRLAAWCKLNRSELVDDQGRLDARQLSALNEEHNLGGYSYWAGIIAGQADRSFAQVKARKVEDALGIPQFHLEGIDAVWPFTAELKTHLESSDDPDIFRKAENAIRALLDITTLPAPKFRKVLHR